MRLRAYNVRREFRLLFRSLIIINCRYETKFPQCAARIFVRCTHSVCNLRHYNDIKALSKHVRCSKAVIPPVGLCLKQRIGLYCRKQKQYTSWKYQRYSTRNMLINSVFHTDPFFSLLLLSFFLRFLWTVLYCHNSLASHCTFQDIYMY